MKGILYTDRNDLKEANTRRTSNLVTSNRLNKDDQQIAQRAMDDLQRAERIDCKQMLK